MEPQTHGRLRYAEQERGWRVSAGHKVQNRLKIANQRTCFTENHAHSRFLCVEREREEKPEA